LPLSFLGFLAIGLPSLLLKRAFGVLLNATGEIYILTAK
jgi:hypothetical protein